MNDRERVRFRHRRNKHYDEIIVFWCSGTENTHQARMDVIGNNNMLNVNTTAQIQFHDFQ